MLVIILHFFLIFIVIQTTEGRKNLDYINQSINPRELKKERKNLNRNESSFLSPPVLLKKGKEVTKVTI